MRRRPDTAQLAIIVLVLLALGCALVAVGLIG